MKYKGRIAAGILGVGLLLASPTHEAEAPRTYISSLARSVGTPAPLEFGDTCTVRFRDGSIYSRRGNAAIYGSTSSDVLFEGFLRDGDELYKVSIDGNPRGLEYLLEDILLEMDVMPQIRVAQWLSEEMLAPREGKWAYGRLQGSITPQEYRKDEFLQGFAYLAHRSGCKKEP